MLLQEVGRYCILCDIIKTKSSLIQSAYDADTHTTVILKTPQDPALAHHEYILLSKLSTLSCAYIISPLDFYSNSSNDSFTLVFGEFAKIPKQLNLLAIAKYIKQLATALSLVHDINWAHLDISPANIVYKPSTDSVVLIDWALSRECNSNHPAGRGTLGFIAPELYSGVSDGVTPDVYSLGIIFGMWIEMYCQGYSLHYLGSKFTRPSTTDYIIHKLSSVLQDSLNTFSPIISKASDLLVKMLNSNPQERITCKDVLKHPFINAPREEFDGFDYISVSQKYRIDYYLQQLPKSIAIKLFSHPVNCISLLRIVPPLAKHVILRLLYTSNPCQLDDLVIHNDAIGRMNECISQLSRFSIIYIKDGISLNESFRENLHFALVGGGTIPSFGHPTDSNDKYEITIAFLDEYATNCWESILHYLVGTQLKEKSKAVLNLLYRLGLLQTVFGNQLKITNKGFQFLLQDTQVQVWAYLQQYLELSEDMNLDLVEALNFLFTLSCLELGKDYAVSLLTSTQQIMLEDWRQLGLIYQRKKKSSRFYPTRLATCLIHSRKDSTASEGYIIIETNYRVYSYTNSALQISILSLFLGMALGLVNIVHVIDMKARFGNMVMGMLTRDSVREALSNGITAEQIISFLATHAHPEMKKNSNSIIPETIMDQIRLWELEKNRIRVFSGYLYESFVRQEDYLSVLKYAQDFNYVLWHLDRKRMMMISDQGHEHVKLYIKQTTVS